MIRRLAVMKAVCRSCVRADRRDRVRIDARTQRPRRLCPHRRDVGTIMAANVWMRILPPSEKMIEAINAGNKPDEKLAAQAKLRSKRTPFMVVPVVSS